MTINGKRYRLKSRARFMIFLAIAIILLVSVTNTALGLNNASSLTMQQYAQIEIQSGDTLWDIALIHMPDTDVRKAVYTICQLNDISAETLRPGQVIDVPVCL